MVIRAGRCSGGICDVTAQRLWSQVVGELQHRGGGVSLLSLCGMCVSAETNTLHVILLGNCGTSCFRGVKGTHCRQSRHIYILIMSIYMSIYRCLYIMSMSIYIYRHNQVLCVVFLLLQVAFNADDHPTASQALVHSFITNSPILLVSVSPAGTGPVSVITPPPSHTHTHTPHTSYHRTLAQAPLMLFNCCACPPPKHTQVAYNPDDRPTASQALVHPFIANSPVLPASVSPAGTGTVSVMASGASTAAAAAMRSLDSTVGTVGRKVTEALPKGVFSGCVGGSNVCGRQGGEGWLRGMQ